MVILISTTSTFESKNGSKRDMFAEITRIFDGFREIMHSKQRAVSLSVDNQSFSCKICHVGKIEPNILISHPSVCIKCKCKNPRNLFPEF